jgi:subtilisin family serine protease
MDLENAQPGYAFENDYPESYEDRIEELQQVLRRQLDELKRFRTGCRAAELLGILRGRRGDLSELVQLDVIPRKGSDVPALAARGELMMQFPAYAKRGVRAALEDRGYGAYVPAARRTDLVQLRHRDKRVPDVRSARSAAADLDASAWHNYVATMAAVGKGIGGPEPLVGFDFKAGPEGAGAGPVVAVIDTGIVDAPRDDRWLNNVRRDDNIDPLDMLPVPDGFLDFQAGHGTFVAGIVQRVAPDAEIRMYRAADTDGFATDVGIADAIHRAYEDGAKIINLSLGGRTVDDEPPPAMAETVQRIRDADDEVVLVAAAGNFGDTAPCWPAALYGVWAVAGLTAGLKGAEWSSRGDVQFSAVAEGIRSTFVTGRESPVFDREPETFARDAWALWTGTSFAAPQISGAIARICRELGRSPRWAAEKLAERGKTIPNYGQAMHILQGIR